MATNATPAGCGPDVDSLYYSLCDLSAAWGVVLEAFASTGVVFALVLFMSLLASLPFTKDQNRRSSVGLHAGLLVFTAGLFCLTFAFIVGKDFATCASRRFLFGVLFGGCFSCLLMQSVRVNVLARRNSAPPAWALCLGAAGLWLVEVVVNTEWLIVTVVRLPLPPLPPPLNGTSETSRATATPCNIANEDFVMALIYVMVLIVATLTASAAVVCGKHKRWWREGASVFLAAVLSVGVWAAWISMYVHGNGKHGSPPSWDDPTLAIALVANAWTFVIVYSIPEVCCLSADDQDQQGGAGEEPYANHGGGYENILKEHGAQSVFMENKGFQMDEPNPGAKPVSPYSGYTGQLRSSVYQPTELALITKSVGNLPPDAVSHDLVIPRATAVSSASSSSAHVRTNGHGGNGLHRTSQW